MHESASNGVVGDASRGGGVMPSSRVCVSDQLRNLADWLDAHPGAQVSSVSLIDYVFLAGPVRVSDFGAGSVEAIEARAVAIGGEWVVDETETMWRRRQAIMPGFVFEIATSKPHPEDVAA